MSPKPAKIIYFPMEIASRELDSRLLLAAIGASRGFEVVLGQKWLIERNIESMTPGVYLSKTLTLRDAKALQRAKQAGYITAAVDEEIPGMIVQDNMFWWTAREAMAATNLIFISGTQNSAGIVAHFGLSQDGVRRAANPRWDLLRKELRSVFAQEASKLRQRYGDFILVNSNLGLTNSEKGSAEDLVRILIEQGKVRADDAVLLRHFDNIAAMEMENRDAVVALLPMLAQRFPNMRIILRPHPSEDIRIWHQWVGEAPNLTIIREGSAIPWILASRVLVHTNCTTGVEAVALDKPAICLVPAENPANRWYLASSVNPVATSVEAAIAEVERVLVAPDLCYSEKMVACFRDSMSFEPDRLGAETMIADILALGNARGWRETSSAVSDWCAYSGYRWHQKDKNVRGVLFPEESLSSVEARLEQYAGLLGLDNRLRIEACGSKVILLSARPLALGTRMRRAIGVLQRA